MPTWSVAGSLEGPKGDKGDAGSQGVQGPAGNPGVTGATGPAGATGHAVTVFEQTTEPSAAVAGDIWIVT